MKMGWIEKSTTATFTPAELKVLKDALSDYQDGLDSADEDVDNETRQYVEIQLDRIWEKLDL